MKDKINISLLIKLWVKWKMRYSIQPRDWIFAKGYGVFVFCWKYGRNM